MFGSIGGAEIVLLLGLALLLFGPRKLPQIGRTLGRSLTEFRRATTEFRASLEREVDLDEIRTTRQEIDETVKDVKNISVPRVAPPPKPAADTVAEPPVAAPERVDSDDS